jgi:RNA polymerase sigma-70 factor (ECF subfamily)
MTDQELIAGIIARDKHAVQFLVSIYHKQVIKTAHHFVRNMDDAEDLAQDVCIEILESVQHFKGSSTLSTWIYRVTVNKSLNFIRKNKRKQLLGQVESLFKRTNCLYEQKVPEPSVNDNTFEDKERRHLLDKSINSLPENQRIAFVLNKYEDLPYKQIAEIMNVSLASVESLLQRAKQNLQKRLIHQFSEYSNKK